MDLWKVFPTISGFERVEPDQVRLYVEGPTPEPKFDRPRGVRTDLFYLLGGRDAEAVLEWLAGSGRVWQVMRVPPAYTSQLGVRAVLIASDWHCGEVSAIYRLARDRAIADDGERERLRREVRTLIASVLENPVRDGELEDLQTLEDAVNTAPSGVELATTAEVVAAFFGDAG